MKRLLLVFLILMGCAKNDLKVSDALTGHWTFQSSEVSGDFTIINSTDGYSLQAGGIFTINNVAYTCDQFWIPARSSGNIDIYLGSPIKNNSREAMLLFSIHPSTLQYSVLKPTNVYYEIKKENRLVKVKDEFVLQKK